MATLSAILATAVIGGAATLSLVMLGPKEKPAVVGGCEETVRLHSPEGKALAKKLKAKIPGDYSKEFADVGKAVSFCNQRQIPPVVDLSFRHIPR